MMLLRRQTPSSGSFCHLPGRDYQPGISVPAQLDDEHQPLLGLLQCDAYGHLSACHRASKCGPNKGATTTFKTHRVAVYPAYVIRATPRANVTRRKSGLLAALHSRENAGRCPFRAEGYGVLAALPRLRAPGTAKRAAPPQVPPASLALLRRVRAPVAGQGRCRPKTGSARSQRENPVALRSQSAGM